MFGMWNDQAFGKGLPKKTVNVQKTGKFGGHNQGGSNQF